MRMAGWLVAARLSVGLLSWPWLFRPHAGPQLDNDCGATWPINMCAGRLAFKLAEAGGGCSTLLSQGPYLGH